ncbi:MAG: RNA polymerase sigma factor [Bacteroidetes bacterium]|nr:RNA polymerase sigma factor [Bacteroidota bacterium]
MLKVKSGDLDRMALLFQRYHRPLYGFLYHMTGQKEASEDMVQNVFYRMLRSRHTFTGQGEFRTWMYHLARNVLKDYLKKAGRYRRMPEWEERPTDDELLEEQLEKKQELEMLQKKIESLSPESREVLVLSRYQDLKYTEIAGVLDISVAAVKVRIHRAIRQLKTLYLQTE